MSIEQLKAVLEPPANPVATGKLGDWGKVVNRLGTRMPMDYMDFVKTYGAGEISEFLRVFTPFTDSCGLFTSGLRWLGSLNKMKRSDSSTISHPLYFEPGGLLPIGDGDDLVVCWKTEGPPDEWTIASWEPRSGDGWQSFNTGLTEFLADLLANKLRVSWYEPQTGAHEFKTF